MEKNIGCLGICKRFDIRYGLRGLLLKKEICKDNVNSCVAIYDYENMTFFKNKEGLLEYCYLNDYEKILRKEFNNGTPMSQFSWITISPDKLKTGEIFYSAENIAKLVNFCKCISYLYHEYEWVVESGKHADRPHLHIHMLVRIKNSKKHAQMLRAKWEELCGFNIRWKSDDYLLKQYRLSDDMPSYDDWVQEKINYMTNEYKGTHANFEVLDSARGGTGVSTANF